MNEPCTPSVRSVAWILAVCSAALAPSSAGAQVDSLALRDHAKVLAHDSLGGRDTGSSGERAAAAYIAEQLERLGLEPVHAAGYRIPLPLVRPTLGPESRIRLLGGADTLVFRPWVDFAPGRSGRAGLRGFRGPAVYPVDAVAGRPARDLAGTVVLTTAPGEEDREVVRAWIDQGVEALLLPVQDPAALAELRAQAADRLIVDGRLDDPVWQPDLPVILAGPRILEALASRARPDPARGIVDLGMIIEADLSYAPDPVMSANVAGLLVGADAALRDEVVLLTAHYDHLGVGPAVEGDSIYNGFSDNAAGVAMLLEIAAALRAEPPPRSVAFLFTSGEERGLLGATAWAADPPIPLERTVAVVNLDAGAPPAPPVRWRVAGDTAALAVRAAAAVIESRGWTADRTGANANSDHWPFMERGVPTVFLVPGREWEGRNAEAGRRLFETWDRYHHPGDEWREGYPLSGLVRYAELALAIVRQLAAGR